MEDEVGEDDERTWGGKRLCVGGEGAFYHAREVSLRIADGSIYLVNSHELIDLLVV